MRTDDVTQAVDVLTELALLRARVAALETLADFFLGKKEGWGCPQNAGPHTPAFACAPGSHVTWGCDSEQAKAKDSLPARAVQHGHWIPGPYTDSRLVAGNSPRSLDRVVDEWIRFPGDVQGAGC